MCVESDLILYICGDLCSYVYIYSMCVSKDEYSKSECREPLNLGGILAIVAEGIHKLTTVVC